MSGLDLTRRGLIGVLAGGAAWPMGARAQGAAGIFTHGVASGDPQADRVILWTRAAPEGRGRASVRWMVARDEEMSDIAAQGEVETGPDRDFTVKVDAAGLEPGRQYFYRFASGDAVSVIGRTRTLPRADAQTAKLAAISCSNHPAGYFNVYRMLARRGDLDAIIHLGDYIYEYPPGSYATEWGAENGRIPEPPKEIVSLSDYRTRYAQYHSDPDLQAAHQAHPFICIWDDHETANNSWINGAENHGEDEGSWNARKRAAVQAYMEWMPIREPGRGAAREAIWRTFDFGKAASLIMLETRLTARSEQLEYGEDLPYPERTFALGGEAPQLIADPSAAEGRDIERLPALVERGSGGWTDIEDYQRLRELAGRDKLPRNVKRRPDVETFKATLSNPDRELLGAAQLDYAAQEMERSRRAGVTWQALGNQVILAKVRGPHYARDLPWWYKLMMNRGEGADANQAFLDRSLWDLPMNLDAWDGYPAERERFYDAAREAGANLAAMTGDTHSFWANNLTDARGDLRGVEFGTSSVTSPGMFSSYQAPTVDFGQMMMDAAPDVIHANPDDRGAVIITFTPERADGEYIRVSTIESRDFEEDSYARYAAAPGGGMAAV